MDMDPLRRLYLKARDKDQLVISFGKRIAKRTGNIELLLPTGELSNVKQQGKLRLDTQTFVSVLSRNPAQLFSG